MSILALMKNIEAKYKDDPLAKVIVKGVWRDTTQPISAFLDREVQGVDAKGAFIGEAVPLRDLPESAVAVVSTVNGHYSAHNYYQSVGMYLSGVKIDVQTYPTDDHKNHKVTITAPGEDPEDNDEDPGDPD